MVALHDPVSLASVATPQAVELAAQPTVDLVALVNNAVTEQATRAVRGAAIGVFQAVATILAVRLLLLLALIGGFLLAWQALQLNSPQAVAVLIAYAVLIMIPLVYLERAPKKGPTP